MLYYNTILNQITAIIPRHELDSLAEQHNSVRNCSGRIYKTAVDLTEKRIEVAKAESRKSFL
jgi:hypothetical protein